MDPRIHQRAGLVAVAVLLCFCSGTRAEALSPASAAQESADEVQVHHAINYIEFSVTDMDEAKRFYAAAFGWTFNDYGPSYAGIRRGDGEAGGFRLESEVKPGGPLVILYSEDLDRTLELVREAGGQIVREPFDFPGGRRFHFADPSGNELAVWAEP